MLLITHIIIAISSLGLTGFTFLSPSKNKLYFSYLLVLFTLISGTYLVFMKPGHLTQTCITGLIYLGFVTVGLASAHKKLSLRETSDN